ncbi:hypothetical protein ACHY7Y_000245 [Citrobacter freundii]
MFHVDNNSAVPVMPAVKPVVSAVTSFFTEGGNGVPPTYPGPDWFNIIQSELLAVLAAAGITPDKASNVQLLAAMRALFLDTSQNGADIQDKALFLQNLGLQLAKRIEGNDTYTGLTNPDGSAVISVFNDKTWGAFSGNTVIPLALSAGGLGATTASGGRANLGLKTAALRDVGTGPNQIPDMGSFTFSGDANSWAAVFPNGLIIQGGVSTTIDPPNTYDTVVQFRVPFPSRLLYLGEHDSDGQGALTLWSFSNKTLSGFKCAAITRIVQGATQLSPITASACLWIAAGV